VQSGVEGLWVEKREAWSKGKHRKAPRNRVGEIGERKEYIGKSCKMKL
jgi:hypothetical protein